MCEVFVLLARCASLDVLIDPDPLQGPEIIVLDFPYCFVAAWVPCAPVVVILPEDLPFKGVIWWDNQLSSLVPPCCPPWFFVSFDGEGLLPSFHSQLMSHLCFHYFILDRSQVACLKDVQGCIW